MWRAAMSLVFAVGCVQSASVQCDNGLTCPAGYTCHPVHGCASPEQLEQCSGMADKSPCTTAAFGNGYCDVDVCMPSRCGDGVRAPEEICDGEQFSTISTCDQVGFYSTNKLGCSATCELDRSPCSGVCGDDQINGGELCDGTASFSATCVDFGHGAGRLECASTCGPDVSVCTPFGWQSVQVPANVFYLHGTQSSNVWAVGYNGMIRRFDGNSWSSLDVSTCASAFAALGPVFVLSATDAFVVNGDGILRITSTSCTRSKLGTEYYFPSLWASSIDDAYVLSDDNGTSAIWHFNGSSWSIADNAGYFSSVWGTGSHVYATEYGDRLRHYDGQNWSWITVPGLVYANAVWGTGPGDLYVGGNSSNNRAIVRHFTTADGWTTLLTDLPLLGLTPTERSTVFRGAMAGSRQFVMATALSGNGAQRYHLLAYDGTGWVGVQ